MLGLHSASSLAWKLCFFEAPHRIARTLTEAAKYFGNRPIVVGRELTKMHQEFLRGTAQQLAERLGDPRGEFTVSSDQLKMPVKFASSAVSDEQLADEFGHNTEIGRLRPAGGRGDSRSKVRTPRPGRLRSYRARKKVRPNWSVSCKRIADLMIDVHRCLIFTS